VEFELYIIFITQVSEFKSVTTSLIKGGKIFSFMPFFKKASGWFRCLFLNPNILPFVRLSCFYIQHFMLYFFYVLTPKLELIRKDYATSLHWRVNLILCVFRPLIDLKNSKVIDQDSTAYELTISGAFALSGKRVMFMTWRLLIRNEDSITSGF